MFLSLAAMSQCQALADFPPLMEQIFWTLCHPGSVERGRARSGSWAGLCHSVSLLLYHPTEQTLLLFDEQTV